MNRVTKSERGRWWLVVLLVSVCASCTKPQEKGSTREATPGATYFKVNPRTAGVLSGKILFAGKRPARKKVDVSEDPQCAAMHKNGLYDESLAVNPNGTIANAFVYIKAGLEGDVFAPAAAAVTIDQKGCWFEPRVLGIQTGQTLRVTNSDPVTHNIHPQAVVNRGWNQSQSEGATPLMRRFTKPEVMIPVKCNIHEWMHAWIGVVDSPYFAVTEGDGTFEMKNVPPGHYRVAVWQELLGTEEQDVTLEPSGHGTVTFSYKGA